MSDFKISAILNADPAGFKAGIDTVVQQAKKMASEMQQTSGRTKVLSDAMKKAGLSASDQANAMKKMGLASEETEGKSKSLASSLGEVAVVAAGITAAFETVKDSLSEYTTHADAVTDLSALLAAKGVKGADAMTEHEERFADALQKTTNISRDQILQMEGMGVGMGVAAGRIEETTKTAIGLSKALGGQVSVASAMQYVARAQMGNTTMLTRYIPALASAKTQAEKYAMIQKMAAAGMSAVTAETENAAGAGKQMSLQWHDLLEKLGDFIAHALLPFEKIMIKVIEYMQNAGPVFTTVASAIGGLLVGVVAVIGAVKTWTIVQELLNVTLKDNPIGITIAVIAGLVAGIVAAYNHFTWFRAAVQGAWAVLKDLGTFIKDEFIGGLTMLYDAVIGVVDVFKGKFHEASDSFKKVGTDFVNSYKKMFNDVKGMANDAINAYDKVEAVSNLTDQIKMFNKQLDIQNEKLAESKKGSDQWKEAKKWVDTYTAAIAQANSELTKLGEKNIAANTAVDVGSNAGGAVGGKGKKGKSWAEYFKEANDKGKQEVLDDTNNFLVKMQKEEKAAAKKTADAKKKADAEQEKANQEMLKKIIEDTKKAEAKKLKVMQASAAKIAAVISGVASDVGSNIGAVITGKANFKDVFKSLLGELAKALGDFIKKKGEMLIKAGTIDIIAGNALVASSLGTNPIGYQQVSEGTGEVTAGNGLTVAGSVISAIKLAKGGIISGSTFANIGEYAGASHNPEVVAPLDKLRNMIGGGNVHHMSAEISGDKLILLTERVTRFNGNSTGGGLGGY